MNELHTAHEEPGHRLHTAKHAAAEASEELAILATLGDRCTAMADRLTGWLADDEFIRMVARGYTAHEHCQFPEGAEAASEVLNTLRHVRDDLRDAAVVLSDD
jgi:hypothetical protein